jgi:hypothetical protein
MSLEEFSKEFYERRDIMLGLGLLVRRTHDRLEPYT